MRPFLLALLAAGLSLSACTDRAGAPDGAAPEVTAEVTAEAADDAAESRPGGPATGPVPDELIINPDTGAVGR